MSQPDWPEGADGDVFRQLAYLDFDFSQPHEVEYTVDFSTWPPPAEAEEILSKIFLTVDLFGPEEDDEEEEIEEDNGIAVCTTHGLVTYETVVATMRRADEAMAPFGGKCDSWGVTQS